MFSFNRKPLPKVDQQTPGVNDLDLQLQEVRMMEKVPYLLQNFKHYF